MNTVPLLTVFVENKPGETARITRILADAKVNIRWVTIATTPRFGVMKSLLDHVEEGLRALRAQGLTVSPMDALAVEVKDKPGALHQVADLLARHRINVENVSGFVAHDRAVVVIEVEEVPRAGATLARQGLRLLSQKEMLGL